MNIKILKLILLLLIGFDISSFSQIKINEVMHLPVNKEPEWIELINYQNEFVDSLHLILSDPKGAFSLKLQKIQPYQYIILVKDTNLLKKYRSIPDTSKLVQTKIPSLNNAGDSLILKTDDGTIIDSFYFGKDFGKIGISLERKNPFLPADNKENLQPSISPDSATCGMKNSISYQPVDTFNLYDEIHIEPNPFSPNSNKNRCKITIYAKEYIHNLSIKIYDVSGNLVKTLLQTESGDKFIRKEIEWDGTNNNQYVVQMGPYPVLIEYQLVSNNKRITHKSIIVVGN